MTDATDAVRREPPHPDMRAPLAPDMFDPVCPSSAMPFRVGDWGHRPRP
ncbi:hypothetical protein ABTY96_35030 [Streptomyces sp. NPDC096057]